MLHSSQGETKNSWQMEKVLMPRMSTPELNYISVSAPKFRLKESQAKIIFQLWCLLVVSAGLKNHYVVAHSSLIKNNDHI